MADLEKDVAIAGIGDVDFGFVDGKLVAKVSMSPKALLDMLAAKIGGPVPAEVAVWVEGALGLK